MAPHSDRLPISDEARASPLISPQPADASSPKSFESDNPLPELIARDLQKARRLQGVSFSVFNAETLVVLGPSGAGKTTLLRIIAGLETADSGTLQLSGSDLLSLAAPQRRVAMVSQDDALFPHMTVYENLSFPLRIRAARAAEIDKRVRSIAAALNIDGHLPYRPARLSGGERQRAALARAVLSEPRVLLLDEPLAHLDPQLRVHIRREFMRFRSAFSAPAIHVTHDHLEALSIGQRVAIMIDGRIVQIGEPSSVYDWPASVEVARFLGSPPMNLLNGDMEIIGIRPEHVRIDPGALVRGFVTSRESSGADVFAHVRTARGDLIVRLPAAQASPMVGEEVGLEFDQRFVRRFSAGTGMSLS